MWPSSPTHLALLAIAGLAAISDARSGRIPNSLTLPPLLIAPLAQLFLDGPGAGVDAVAGIFVCGCVPYLLFRKDAMGGGDVKLFSALGGICGVELGIEVQLFAFLSTGLMALAYLAWQGALWRTLIQTARLALGTVVPRLASVEPTPATTLRMGPPIFVACVVVLCLRFPVLWS